MSKHPHAVLLENIYADFTRGNYEKVLAACADQMTFQVAGKSPLAGKYTKADFVSGLATKLRELSGGSFRLEAHDILASDRHGVVLVSAHLERKGQPVQLRSAHVWRIENGKPVAWYDYTRDLYQHDATWA